MIVCRLYTPWSRAGVPRVERVSNVCSVWCWEVFEVEKLSLLVRFHHTGSKSTKMVNTMQICRLACGNLVISSKLRL